MAITSSVLTPQDVSLPKTCIKCGVEKTMGDFHKNSQSRDGRHPYCRTCKNKGAQGYYQRWDDRQRLLHRSRVMRSRYGISQDEWDQLHAKQNGRCAICDGPPKGRRPRLCVDHDHKTGQVRGLLCDLCNTALGKLQDDAALLRRAVAYLEMDRGESNRH